MLSPNAADGGMIITSNSLTAELINNPSFGAKSVTYNGTSIPTSHLVDATAGDFYSRIQVDYTASGGGETLSHKFFQKRDGDFGDNSQGFASEMLFTVDANTTYSLSGKFDVTDVTSSSPGSVHFVGYLFDATTSTYLFLSEQSSRETANESYVLGGIGGDWSNDLAGSLTGNLIAGHIYKWHSLASIIAYTVTGDGGASAEGDITLKIGSGGSAVPEPSSIAMWSLGAIGMMFARRKRQQKKLAA